jgi:23S rRNA (cytidine1920-2'-O)/16S rRNA (cytidine1409-2'-O)-methyltransferase
VAADLGWLVAGVSASPLPGPSGNVEFFLWLQAEPAAPLSDAEIRTIVETAEVTG